MKAYVLDASVAAKWFLPPAHERLTENAVMLLGDYVEGRLRLLVPDLFWPEFGNVLWKAVRQGRITRRSANEALLTLKEMKISSVPTVTLLQDAFAIAREFGRTVYDATYVALAVSAGAPLITADERLGHSLGLQFPIQWLGSFSG